MTDKEYLKMITPYDDAREMMVRRLSALNHTLYDEHCPRPIHSIHSRVKDKASLESKLENKGFDLSVSSAVNNLQDIAGVRVICYFIKDVYMLVSILKRQRDLTVIEEIDYIKNPKHNGYRSYHVILSIPVYYLDCSKDIIVEVQFRTLSMDFWASMEHRLVYKKNMQNKGNIEKEMSMYADTLMQLEERIHQLSILTNNNDTGKMELFV